MSKLENFLYPESKIEGYEVFARKSYFSIFVMMFPMILFLTLAILLMCSKDAAIIIIGIVSLMPAIYLLGKMTHNIFQPRILIYINEDSLLINKKHKIYIKDITSYYKKDKMVRSDRRKIKENLLWFSNIYIEADNKKYVIRNVEDSHEVIDFLYRIKKQKKFKNIN